MAESKSKRDLVVVSGYYGFGNLGDEAILEEIVCELKRLVAPEKIVVLSANPESTARTFGVRAEPRSDLGNLALLLQRAILLVSGGGGLFQDTRSAGSAIFYGGHILLARICGARSIVYAQGVGPLRSKLATFITLGAFGLCDGICVRDQGSRDLVNSWRLPAELTADPVWSLEATALPQAIQDQLKELTTGRNENRPLIGLSLRPSADFTDLHLKHLQSALSDALPPGARLLLLPLQKGQDEPLLKRFQQDWQGETSMVDPDMITHPSQWINLLSKLDLLVSMRLHALIMALRSAVPSVGIAYDPKVTSLLTDFEQPILILTKEGGTENWASTVKKAYIQRKELSSRAAAKAESIKKLACQNFNLISRILSMQSDP